MKCFPILSRLLCLGLTLAPAGAALAQQAWPSKPVRIIVPYGPGASTDNVTRIYGQKITEAWGQPVVVDNKPGGNTLIGSEALVKSAPDGYTILLVVNTHAINPLLIPKLPYDPVRDFAPVATVGSQEFMLTVNPVVVPVGNLKEFIAYAKARPGQLNFSSSGGGGLSHLSGELFNSIAGVKMLHVPYKGGAPAVTDLVAGQVQLMFSSPSSVLPNVKSGRLRGIAISGKIRTAALPDVPTFAEAGLPNFEATNWFGILAPAATPRDIVNKLSAELVRTQSLPDVREKLAGQGVDAWPMGPEQFAALIKSDMEKFARIVKSANIKLEL
jgi:tripartite-type tricarboxylate transporter receptor subunit TctC